MEDWEKYADIIGLEHPEPRTLPRMAASDRAAQFAPFSALTGYDAMVSEASRLTESRIELDEEQRLALDSVLADIIARAGEHPYVRIVHFVRDSRKTGGEYVTSEGHVRDVELPNRRILLKDGRAISLDDILRMEDGEAASCFGEAIQGDGK